MLNKDKDAELNRLKNIKCFFVDLDGTFYLENRILAGSLEFLQEMQNRGIKVLFLTNNSSKSSQYYIERLKKMNVKEPFLNILTSGDAICDYAMQHFPNQKAFLFANQIVTSDMQEKGLIIDNDNPDYVLITYDTELTYQKMDRVCYYVRQGLPYIASHPDFNCPTKYGFAPDIGATIAYIKASTNREPDLIIGKPYAGIIDEALKIMQVKRNEVAMIGDRLYTDVKAGIDNDLLGILVLSGETDLAMLEASSINPDLIYPSLIDIVADL